MSKPAHTPGPWAVEPHTTWDSADQKYKPDAGCFDRIGPLDVGCTYADDVWIEVSEANAHLIAAAPDLYAALKPLGGTGWAVDAPEWRDRDTVSVLLTIGELRAARAALAKARGEA